MCRSCEIDATLDTFPIYERLYVDDHWRVSHGWSSLPGWLVVSLRRHALSLHELNAEETRLLGGLQQAASVALHEIVGSERTYVMLFAEHRDYHLHFHIVPRMPWFGPDDFAGSVFRYLNVPEEQQVPTAERERLAMEIGNALRSGTIQA
ncbi:MAG TPA: hypothetical protein VGL84_09235 [Gaiellaceae bacterium]|jgi:diadenosine tetraphosphate (Ap4A) HIT family hydrolase